MPYFQGDQSVRGYMVIGHECDETDMMIPSWNYDCYCAAEVLNEKKQQIQEEKIQDEEREKNLGWTYIPLSQCWNNMPCCPINGYLAEKFFDETGLGRILDQASFCTYCKEP